jgi:hypothetical protein
VDFYNKYKFSDVVDMLKEVYPDINSRGNKLFENENPIHYRHGLLWFEETNLSDFNPNYGYSAFMILTMLEFKGDYEYAYAFVKYKIMNVEMDFVRIGTDYFKKIKKRDRFGIYRDELKRWSKDILVTDYGRGFLKDIPRLDGFTLVPSNVSYKPVIDKHYNLYSPFMHKHKQGKWEWTEKLLRHVFGDQYELGLKYMQALYLHPTQALPILVLSSRERATGKSTFVNWLTQLFGANMTVVSPQDIENTHNGSYADANIIAIEETSSDKRHLVEKLKDLSTKKTLAVNKKYIDHFNVPFFGKFVITTNDTEKFLLVDEEEIRFWVRELGIPKFFNAQIEDNLAKEIPAFLYHLLTLPELDCTKSRMVFTPEEIRTDQLKKVKENSKSWLYKELVEQFTVFFDDYNFDEIFIHPMDIKKRWFDHNSKVEISYLRKVLKNDFNLTTTDNMRYIPFGISTGHESKRQGKVFHIKRSMVEKLAEKL